MTATITFFRNASDATPYPAGTVIFRDGDPGHEMFIVVEGEVEIRIGDVVVDVVGPGGIFGEMAIIDAAPRSATAIARVDAKLVAVAQKRFMFLLQQTPQFAIQVMRIMTDRLKRKDPAHGPSASA